MIIAQEDLDSKPLHKIIFEMLDLEELKYKTRKEIFQNLTLLGLQVTENKIWTELNYHHEEFYLLKIEKTHLIGLRKWVPVFFKTKKATRKYAEDRDLSHFSNRSVSSRNYLDSSKIVYHNLNEEEIKHGYIHLNPYFVGLFSDISSNSEVIPIRIICFNGNIFQGWLKKINNLLYCEDFKSYFNNKCKIGDVIKYQKDNKSTDGIFLHIDMIKENKLLLLNSSVDSNEEPVSPKIIITNIKSKIEVGINRKIFILVAIAFIIIVYVFIIITTLGVR